MIAIDTNVLVRLLINDPEAMAQCEQARKLIKGYAKAWVSKVVLVETVWVLESVYELNKQQIILLLEKLVQHPRIDLENAGHINSALTLFSAIHGDFADCIILSDALHKQLTLHTFDKKLSRLHGAELIVGKD